MTQKAIETTLARLQQLLERDYPHLEWRVRFAPAPTGQPAAAATVAVSARTRDFRSRHRLERPWAAVAASPTLEALVAEIAAEAERVLAQEPPS